MAERAESRVRWFLVFGLFILSAFAYLDASISPSRGAPSPPSII